jgi:methylated-DNA-[protein]-cysteine S-methyltransferase
MDYGIVPTKWGSFGFVAQDEQLVATFLPRPATDVRKSIALRFPDANPNNRCLPGFRQEVQDYFGGSPVEFSVAVDVSGFTSFQQAVLNACHRVPFGQTASYAELARRVGHPNAARAVGGVMALNPLPLVIPCHRVVHSDRSLGGFSSSGGVSEKERMLRLEFEALQGKRSGRRVRRRPLTSVTV